MEQRSNSPAGAEQPVEVTVLGERDITTRGRIIHCSHQGLGLLIGSPIALGAAVKVTWGHVLLLGEACSCRPVGEDFAVELHLEHALHNTLEIADLARRLLDESAQPERKDAEKPR